jgi:membrane protein required for colicin V production
MRALGERVDIEGFLSSVNLFDLVAALFLFGMFVLGFIQGTIRRLLGLASILFSFLLAGQLRAPLGAFLADNWTQFPPQYSYMLAYLFVFVISAILFSIIIQSFYKHQPLFADSRLVDEVLGGILGVVQGLVLIGIMIVILDSFFEIPGIPPSPNELPVLREVHDWYDPSATAALFRDTLIPAAFALLGGLIPDDVRAFFPGSVPPPAT